MLRCARAGDFPAARALAYYQMGQEDAARAEVAKALEPDPTATASRIEQGSLMRDRAELRRWFAIWRELGLPE